MFILETSFFSPKIPLSHQETTTKTMKTLVVSDLETWIFTIFFAGKKLEHKRSLSGDSAVDLPCLKALGFNQTAMVPPVRSRYTQVELKETRVEN